MTKLEIKSLCDKLVSYICIGCANGVIEMEGCNEEGCDLIRLIRQKENALLCMGEEDNET